MPPSDATYEYIVVGSGAAGATVAARLVEAGKRVLVIEAGPDPLSAGRTASAHYSVPAFHALGSEDPEYCWNQQVRHFPTPLAEEAKLLYPRAGALGGCTAHNAMIFLVPPDADWNSLAEESGDRGWCAESMRTYRKAVEQCRHRPFWKLLSRFGIDPTGHGWDGWLPVEKAIPAQALSDAAVIRTVALSGAVEMGRTAGLLERLRAFIQDWGDPNDVRRHGKDQLCYLPLATALHSRTGARERLLSVDPAAGGSLELATDTLATRVIFDRQNRAIGVEWLSGPHLYRASPASSDASPVKAGTAFASGEVILAAGSFATPQLLMLSGIGDSGHLRSIGIEPRLELPDVGRNLQDRYEISLVHRMKRPWRSLRGARFEKDDPLYRKWRHLRRGMYVSNGTALAALRRSSFAKTANPDLVLMGLMAKFSGYYPGYSRDCWNGLDGFTWAVLKGQTQNRAGTVRLVSSDPRDPPSVDFRNFEENGTEDLEALLEGVSMARRLADPLIECGAALEEIPGREVKDDALRSWVRSNAWGHHACGTAAIGPVLGPSGRVHGVDRLRVVDASIFPKIPGLFIVAAIYLAAEKLAADILAGR